MDSVLNHMVDLRLKNAMAAAKLNQALLVLEGKLPPSYPAASILVAEALDILGDTQPLGNPDRKGKRASYTFVRRPSHD